MKSRMSSPVEKEVTMRITATLVAVSAMLLTVVSPAFAQDTTDGTGGEFRLTLNGDAPENVSFWVESEAPGIEGVICTTDAAMVDSGVAECRDGGAVNELAVTAPAGKSVDYRILGSRGAELSQSVISEGSVAVGDGFVVDAAYTFDTSGGGAADAQYGGEDDGAAGNTDQDIVEDTVKGTPDTGTVADSHDPTGGTGLLPDTGGTSLLAVMAGASLLIAGGFLAYRRAR